MIKKEVKMTWKQADNYVTGLLIFLGLLFGVWELAIWLMM